MKSMDALKAITLLLLCCIAGWVQADVLFLVDGYSSPVAILKERTQKLIQQEIRIISPGNLQEEVKYNDLVVVLGRDLLKFSHLIPPEALSIGLLMSQADYQKHQKNLDTAIYSEPPLERNIRLARSLLGDYASIGLLVSSRKDLPTYEKNKLIRVYAVDEYDSLNHALKRLLIESKALVGVYDYDLYSPANIKNILISSYRRERPLIGPSSAYIAAGALASAYSSIDDITQRLAEVINEAESTGNVPPAGYNPYFHVGLNAQVGHSLNIELPDPEKIAQTLRDQENLRSK